MTQPSPAHLTADRIVVGGGAMGLATAAALTARGLSVVLFERYEPGHTNGASHGATRNFNNAYSEADYLDLFDEARALWGELEAATGRTLLELRGLVTHGSPDRVRAAYDSLAARGAHAELLPAGEAAARWHGFRFEGDVLFSEDAGVVFAEQALVALREVSERGGARLLHSYRVRSIEVLESGDTSAPSSVGASSSVGVADAAPAADRVRVTATDPDGREIIATAPGVIVTAGAWTESLLGGLIDLPPLRVTEEHPAHFQVRDPGLVWPSFNHFPADADAEAHADVDAGATPGPTYPVYGMLTEGEGIKVGFHAVGEEIDPDLRPHSPTDAKRAELREYVAHWFPGLDPDTAVDVSCTYTNTESGDFVLDRVGPVTVGAGFSGHGFKFVPAIGRVLADASQGLADPPRRFRLAAHRPVGS